MKLTARQEEAQKILSGSPTHLMLFGGSRSGKTFLHVRNTIFRALKAPGSRHAILRYRFNHVKASSVLDTFPKVMSLAFPGVDYHIDKTDWYARFLFPETGEESQIWFGGLDDKERTEKILGQEHATIYLNECSQIPQASRDMAVTRLAQKCYVRIKGKESTVLVPRMYYDCNPPSKGHWSYRMFVKKEDPETKRPLAKPDDFACFQMNPQDNAENLSAGYLDALKSLSARMQKRFLLGEFGDSSPNALFRDEDIDKWRITNGKVPDMVRVVVGVDPSGSDDADNADNDEIGIVTAGLGTDGRAYIFEDASVKAGPKTWGGVAAGAYDRHRADVLVGEINYGGAMVGHVIQTARPRTNFKCVTASRGKHVRAEPFSALYEQGKVCHVGYFPEMEDELTAMSTNGYTGTGSPNRADALIWCLTELFAGIVKPKTQDKSNVLPYRPSDSGMGL